MKNLMSIFIYTDVAYFQITIKKKQFLNFQISN